MLIRLSASLSLCLLLSLNACQTVQNNALPQPTEVQQDINPGSKGPKPTEFTGSIITSFDLG